MVFDALDTVQPAMIIAEIGNNHEGSLGRAREMVHAAAAAGVDAVKFQTFQTAQYVSHHDAIRFNRLKSFELGLDAFADLAQLARSLGLLFVSTPFDLVSARSLAEFVDAIKIASGDLLFFPLLAEVARLGRPIILSSGASDL